MLATLCSLIYWQQDKLTPFQIHDSKELKATVDLKPDGPWKEITSESVCD